MSNHFQETNSEYSTIWGGVSIVQGTSDKKYFLMQSLEDGLGSLAVDEAYETEREAVIALADYWQRIAEEGEF